MAKYDDSQIKGWTQLCSDVNWQDYHGMWAKKAKDGSWYVLQWTNMVDAMGECEAAEFSSKYECQVKRIDFDDTTREAMKRACESCGYSVDSNGVIIGHDGAPVLEKYHDLVLIECMIMYGLGAPLEAFYGNGHPLRVRGKARKYAEEMMRDAYALEERLDRPVNAIMTSARDYGSGRPLFASKVGG